MDADGPQISSKDAMKYLFSTAGETALAAQLAQPTLLAFDFDGTLAPLTADPREAHLPARMRPLLAALCAAAPVAIISGRSVADLKDRLGATPKFLIGNHGLEGIPENAARLADCQAICQSWQHQLEPRLAADPALAGVVLDNKGYSLSLHYGLAPLPPAAAPRLRALLAALQPAAAIIGGKQVFNLIPDAASSKRQALHSLLRHEGLEQALYVGDDATDETVFAEAPPPWLTVRVEPSPLSAARFFLRQQEEMTTLLQRIVRKVA